MSRRSTRLASKSKAEGGVLEFEENESHHFNLKTRTPRTPYHRSSQKRKRCFLSNIPEAEVGRTIEANAELTSIVNDPDSPVVLTQNRFQNGIVAASTFLKPTGEAPSPEDGAMKTDLSFGNDSLLMAVDQIENNYQTNRRRNHSTSSNAQRTSNINEQIDTGSTDTGAENCSQDVFGDDAEFMEALPTTPDNEIESSVTPKTSRKRSIVSKKLSVDKPIETDHEAEVVPGTASKEFQQLSENESIKELKSVRKRLAATGDKNKKKTGGGAHGGPSKRKKTGKFKLAFTNRKAIIELANSASNELSKEDLSYMSNEEKLQLSSWGLPLPVLNNYRAKGITSLFQWQLDCLANEKVLEGRNLLYSAPTSAGKTLVSEILMIKRVLELGRKAIMILPFVSVAREKVYSLQSIFGDAGVRVEGFMGSINPPGGFKAVDIAICTIEKANSLLNKLLEEDSLADLGTLVVDELHLIGDPSRGYLLELLLAKIMYMTSIKNNGDTSSANMTDDTTWRPRKYHIQVIGMSATLPNLEVLANWLNAELYVTDFRPVPLKETLKIDDKLLDEDLQHVRDVVTGDLPIEILDDIDNIIYLALETVLNGFSVLIFCPTKVQVERTAEKIADQFFKIGDPTSSAYPPEVGKRLRDTLNPTRIKSVLNQLKQCPGGSDKILINTVMFGIGYHHAGLTYENRDIVESAFKRGILKVIVATSTLSAGVNLPARRVMIATPFFNGSVLDTLVYHQMCGRAGRNGIDTEGESILICPANMKEKGMTLFRGSMPPVRSALLGDGALTSSMKRALLEAIASGIASVTTDVRSYAKCTFLFHSLESGLYEAEELSSSQLHKDSTIDECIKYLETQDFIRIKHYEQEEKPDEFVPTQLGSACLAASMPPDDGIIVYKELLKARECFVLENELHVIYQVTPIYVSAQLNYLSWSDYLRIYDALDLSEKKIAGLVGIKESFIIRASYGSVSSSNPSQKLDMAIHKRFFAALALSDLVNEKSLAYVSAKFNLNKGILQNLQQQASTFAGMVTAFCGRLGWSNLELLLSQFQERLEFGVQRELCDLVRLDCLNGQRARILYDAGIKTVMELAATDPAQVEHILHKATPFNSNVHGGRESYIWMIGKDTLSESEAAQKIVSEARMFIQIELGHRGNVQFAFGFNDVPSPVPEKRQRLSETATTRTVSFKEAASEVNESEESDTEKSETGQMPLDFRHGISPLLARNSEREVTIGLDRNSIETMEEEEEADNHMMELFTQRRNQIENPQVASPNQVQVGLPENSHDDMFEESFPEIITTNISALYLNTTEDNTKRPTSKFLLADHVVADDVSRPNLLHSTPVITNGRNPRFSLKHVEFTSPVPVCTIKSHPSNENEEPRKVEHRESLRNRTDYEQLSEGILAELENEFEDSNTEGFEISLNQTKPEEGQQNKAVNTSLKLSESDTNAMKAIAEEDSKFESEELFPISETKNVALNPDEFGDFDEEDFILTQGPVVQDEEIQDGDMFEESSSDTEQESTCTDESISTCSSDKNQVMLKTMVGRSKLTAKVIYSADVIPDEFFSTSQLIGVGLKLIPSQLKSTSSIARQGIGSRVLGKTPSCTNLNNNETQRPHSIAVYNGHDTIWVLRWNNANSGRFSLGENRSEEVNKLETLLFRLEAYNCYMSIFEWKEKLKSLLKHCGAHILSKLPVGGKILDPRIAQWIWDFDDEDWNVTKKKLVDKYVEDESEKQLAMLGWDKEIVDAFYAWRVMTELKKKLETAGLWDHFINTEMPSTVPLLLMEMNGFGLDSPGLNKLKRVLQFKSNLLELKAFQLAGRQFNLNSSKDIKQVLYKDIGLKQPKAKGTGKAVLSTLDHELPRIIIEYRKVSSALQKIVIPFQQERSLETGRIHGSYSHFTCTGRVVMSDPSLQCIPRDFDIHVSYNEKEISDIKDTCRMTFGSKLNSIFQQLDNELRDRSILENISLISMRNVFIPCSNEFTILTADYSQLELRILAHLSGDDKLVEALNQDVDVFVEIAAHWKNLPKEQITNSIRQEAKGIVYGVIYGMGARTLAEQMEIDEREADKFIRQFMKSYPGVKRFLDESVDACRQKGYVETMNGRRRYLPHIHSRNQHEQAKAHRQAVNSQIQGSAADLVKRAMARIHSFVTLKYPTSSLPIEWTKIAKARRSSSSLSVQGPSSTAVTQLDNVVFFPILNLHDELIFEVKKTHLDEIANRIKGEMEGCLKLRVKLPVVIKTGDTWGNILPYEKSETFK